MYKLIIWDWNGTLLDDAAICVRAMNPLLRARGLQLLDQERYASLFTFPVRDYYNLLGFDLLLEDFSIPAMEFMDQYISLVPQASLRKGLIDIIRLFRRQGFKQVILSAMEQNLLTKLVGDHGLAPYMDGIFGITDHFGSGKQGAASKLMENFQVKAGEIALIGDTIHDMEVAETLGCHCFIIPSGHQNLPRLEKEVKKRPGTRIINRLSELPDFIY